MEQESDALVGLVAGARFTCHFIFSFHFGCNDSLQVFDEAVLKRVVETAKGLYPSESYSHMAADLRPWPETGYAPYLNLRSPMAEITFSYAQRPGPLVIKEALVYMQGRRNLPVASLDGRLSILPSGAGCFRLSVAKEIKNPQDADMALLLALTDLSPSILPPHVTAESLPKLPVGDGWRTVHEIAQLEIARVAESCGLVWDDNPEAKEPIVASVGQLPFQSPFVAMVVEGLKEGTLEPLYMTERFGRWDDQGLNLRKQIAALGSRALFWRNMNMDYVYTNAKILDSSFPGSSVFLNITARGMLCVLDETWQGAEYASLITGAALETVELLRSRWHCLVLANYRLGVHLARTYGRILGTLKETNGLRHPGGKKESVTKKESDKAATRPPWEEILRETSAMRRAISLMLEHPLVYRRAAGSFSELYEKGAKLFGLDALESSVLRRMDELQRATTYRESLREEVEEGYELLGQQRAFSRVRLVLGAVLGVAAVCLWVAGFGLLPVVTLAVAGVAILITSYRGRQRSSSRDL